ncbi:MAG: hypothetical protein V3V35_07375 [Dehalococcoidia bacterium]
MIDRLIPRYPLFLILGFLFMVFSLFFLTAGRDAMILVWANKLFDGDAGQSIFKTTQITDGVIGHTLAVWLFVGLGTIMLGIGFAIATIVGHLRATGQATRETYASIGALEPGEVEVEEPWFGRWFTRLLFSGIVVLLITFVLALWWDANFVFLKRAEFAGHTSGTAWETYSIVERALDPLLRGGKFLGMGLLIVGIATGLGTIIFNLSFQAKGLPAMTRRAMGQGDGDQPREPLRGVVPTGYIGLAIAGAVLVALSLPAGMVQAGFTSFAQAREFDGFISTVALRAGGVLDRAIEPALFLGMGMLFFSIAFLLLVIIRWLREQRAGFGDAVADLSGGAISRPTVEQSVWPERLVVPLAFFGLFILVFFFFTMAAVWSLNFIDMLNLQLAGETDSSAFQNAFRMDRMLRPVIGATRFLGIGTLMLAIGLALVTIVINLRATALLLPTGFSKLVPAAKGEEVEEEDLTVDEPMALAPWELLWPHLAGLAIVITATLPVVVLFAISIHRMLEERFAGLAEPGAMSGLFKSSFLSVQLFGASMQPWMLFGMGLILFAIGRFFATIVTFVELRRMVIIEGVSTIAEAISSKTAPATESSPDQGPDSEEGAAPSEPGLAPA